MKNNGIVFTGYSVEGTLAKQVMNMPKEITISDKKQPLKLKMSVEVISFSAHWDFKQTSHFIKKVKPPNIILVHGDQNEMAKLKKELDLIYKQEINVLAPKNCHTVSFNFVNYKTAKFVGKMVDLTSTMFQNSKIQGIDESVLLKAAQNLEIEQSISLNKMIKMDDTSALEENK